MQKQNLIKIDYLFTKQWCQLSKVLTKNEFQLGVNYPHNNIKSSPKMSANFLKSSAKMVPTLQNLTKNANLIFNKLIKTSKFKLIFIKQLFFHRLWCQLSKAMASVARWKCLPILLVVSQLILVCQGVATNPRLPRTSASQLHELSISQNAANGNNSRSDGASSIQQQLAGRGKNLTAGGRSGSRNR